MAINVIPKAYVLDHPEQQGMTAVAEYRGYWQLNGRNVGLQLQFQGEPFARHLTYKEIERLQRPEEDGPQEEARPCT